MSVVRSKLSTILLAIQARVMLKMAWPEERVGISKRVPIKPQAEQFVQIWPSSQTTHEPVRKGAGRIDTRVTRRVQVRLYTRLAVDTAGDDTHWLTDPLPLGHLDTEHALIDALELFAPEDAAGNWLLYEPMRLQPASEPEKDDAEPEWGSSLMEYDVSFVLDLDQAIQ